MINDYLFENLDGISREVILFQQEGARPHGANFKIDLLVERFGDNTSSRNGQNCFQGSARSLHWIFFIKCLSFIHINQ